jgi:hypothetical protein
LVNMKEDERIEVDTTNTVTKDKSFVAKDRQVTQLSHNSKIQTELQLAKLNSECRKLKFCAKCSFLLTFKSSQTMDSVCLT